MTELAGVDVLGPVALDEQRVRAILRFDYSHGAAVAERLRAELIASATRRPRPLPGRATRRRMPLLRVRVDDSEPFDDPLASRARASGGLPALESGRIDA